MFRIASDIEIGTAQAALERQLGQFIYNESDERPMFSFPILRRSSVAMYQPIYPRKVPLPSAAALPTMYDLPSEDPEDPGLPDLFHLSQPRLLDETFRSPICPADIVLTATDLNLYYDAYQTRWYKRPDWFLVLGVASGSQQSDLRLSYVTWQETVNPFLVVELLSPGTEAEDLGQTLREVNQPPTKWQVYEQILRIPYYVVFDRYTLSVSLVSVSGHAL